MFADVGTEIQISLNEVARLVGNWLNQHFINIIVILIGAWLIRHFGHDIISRLLRHTVRPDLYPTVADRDKRLKTLNSLIGAGTRALVYVIAAILIIGEINPNYTTALFASAGLITVALGFGAQSLIKDFVSGIFIITENQYRVGDFVEIGGVSGQVEDVTIRTTILRDLNGNVHHVPNGIIDVTTNKTMGYSRINEDIVVAQNTDLAKLEHIINHVGEQIAAMPKFANIVTKPPHVANILGYAGTGLVVKVMATTTANDQWSVRSELYKRLQVEFAKHDIEASGMPLLPPIPIPAKKKR